MPANFELHAQAWLSPEPAKHTNESQLALVRGEQGDLVDVIARGRRQRRARYQVFEKALKTIGSFPDAQLFTNHTPASTGVAKFALYDNLLCFIENFLLIEQAHGTLIVDGLNDGGGHLRASHARC